MVHGEVRGAIVWQGGELTPGAKLPPPVENDAITWQGSEPKRIDERSLPVVNDTVA